TPSVSPPHSLLSRAPPHVLLAPLFFFNDPTPSETYTLSLHDALPISGPPPSRPEARPARTGHPQRGGDDEHPRRVEGRRVVEGRSEEHTSELQSLTNLVCRLLLEKKKNTQPQRRRKTQDDTDR